MCIGADEPKTAKVSTALKGVYNIIMNPPTPNIHEPILPTGQELSAERERLAQIGREIVLGAPQLYIDVDIEADGKAGHGSMLSVGAQSPTGESYYSEIKPISEDFMPGQREFCETHGLQRDRLMQEANEYSSVMQEFHDWLKMLEEKYGKPPVFTAFNAGFDFCFVDLYFIKAGLTNPFGIASLDLKSLALPLVGNDWDWSKTSKGKLPPAVLPEGDFTHHALEDAQYQQKLHFGMAGMLGKHI